MGALPAAVLLLAMAAPTRAAAPAPRAYAGIYLADVSAFDLREGRFRADLDVWVKWSGRDEPPALRFVNGEVEAREEQERETDGDWHSVRWRVQGTFRGTFPLQSFPFDRQELRVELALPEDSFRLSPDLASSGMAQQFSITGWEYERFFRAEVGQEEIASDLGSIRAEGRPRTLESVAFVVEMQRPATSNVLKFMLPLAIILAMSFLVFALPSSVLEVRAAMGVTALLSVVAFHFAMSGSLPDVPYLVAADRLFLASYVLVLLSVLETVVVFRLGEERTAAAARLDRASAVVLGLAAAAVAASVITLPLRDGRGDEAAQAQERAPAEAPPSPPSAREELRVGVPSLTSVNAHGLMGLTRRGLTHAGVDGQLRPHLVESVPSMTHESVRLLPDGGMRVRWRLRPNLRWSDGAPLTAKDLVFSLGLIADPDRVEVIQEDERTISIRYRRRLAEALTDFTLHPAHVASAIAADGGLDAIRQRNQTAPLPGDGPYRLASFAPGSEAVFERNPFFAGAPAAIARIRVKVVPPERISASFAARELDFVPALPAATVETVRALPEAAIHAALDETLLLLQPDLSVPALSDVRLRRALLMALDRAELAKAFADEGGRVAHTFRPDNAPDYAADVRRTPHAPAEARRLLGGSGDAPPLKLLLAEAPAGSGYARAAEVLQRQLQAAGVAVEPVTVPSGKAFEAFQRGSHGGLLLHTRRDQRPARFFNLPALPGAVVDTRTERPHFNAELVALYQRYEGSLFPERRLLLSKRLQRAFAEELPLLPIAFGTQLSARARTVSGLDPAHSGSLWWNVERWRLE